MELEEIKQQIKDVFDPLSIRIGLFEIMDSALSYTQFSLFYFNDKIGIELSVDLIDFFIYALLFKPKEHKAPIGYQNKYGQRQKIYFQEALKKLSINCEKETKKLQRLGGNFKNCAEMALELSNLIDKYWPIIYSNHTKWFEKH